MKHEMLLDFGENNGSMRTNSQARAETITASSLQQIKVLLQYSATTMAHCVLDDSDRYLTPVTKLDRPQDAFSLLCNWLATHDLVACRWYRGSHVNSAITVGLQVHRLPDVLFVRAVGPNWPSGALSSNWLADSFFESDRARPQIEISIVSQK